MTAMTNEELETGILCEVVTRFMDHKESTPRRALLIQFEGRQPGMPSAISSLGTAFAAKRLPTQLRTQRSICRLRRRFSFAGSRNCGMRRGPQRPLSFRR